MNNLITLENIYLAFGADVLLDHIKLQISDNERICLIGRNGAGKSSLLKVIAGAMSPDSGDIWRKPQVKVASLAQDLPQETNCTVYEFVADGLAETGKLLSDYHALTARLAHSHTDADLAELEKLQHDIDTQDGWRLDDKIIAALNRLSLNGDVAVTTLSGGWRRRAALARALVGEPDLLLLDEPTNHLDIEAIQWLENELLNCNISLLFITHDRSLLQRLATRIIELDRGALTSWPGDYANFLRRKEEMLHAEAKHNAEFDKKLAQEERWIRQGIKARRTRNEGRVRALKALRVERSARRELQGKASFKVNMAERSGNLVVKAEHISHQFGDQTIIQDFSIQIMRGDRIGLIGPNGAGKSTLLNILLGKLTPQQGQLTLGTKCQVAYFDQLRAALDLEKNAIDNVANGSDMIEINGKNRHVMSYLGDFLFTPQRALTPVKVLSGGECNRLVLARLFSQPSNLLVLDEPTNDLDIETLELLEELLIDYPGTLLLVSHDRTFLDNVVTSTLVFEGNGKIQEYIGGYQDWLQQRKSVAISPSSITKQTSEPSATINNISPEERKELANLPKQIQKLEIEQEKLQQKISAADFYQQSTDKTSPVIEKLKDVSEKIKLAYKRWELLEQLMGNN